MRTRFWLCPLVCSFAWQSLAQEQKPVDVRIVGHINKPAQITATGERILGLKVPAGFRVQRFASQLGNPRILAVAPDGAVYVTRRETGDLLMLRDTDGDGVSDQQTVVAKKPDLHGVAIDGNRVYLATVREVYAAERRQDGSLGELKQILAGLPDGGQHPNRTLAVGPDRMLYVSVGSSCNACPETNAEHATMLRAGLDGESREIYATGLRNTIGFGWHPATGEMWGADHGIDWLGDDDQPEELNRIEKGAAYGWPYVYGMGKINQAVQSPKGRTKEEWAARSRQPALEYTAHAAPMQMVFYSGSQFPPEYRGDAFVAMRGSWNRKPPSGYEVVRIRFRNGKPAAIEPFLTGFLTGAGENWSQFGRPVGVAVARDGALLVSDDTNGCIYRVSAVPANTSDR
ncbi:MAG: PQQ-dependent sugar dehydrogenase [Bryobacteraceae bacterium]|nr:PQQ-dependent sugar dehydrogenase [Bryobacteraceae bacterium]